MKLFSLGISLIVIGSFEKIIIFASLAQKAPYDYEPLKSLTSDIIWNIPNFTIGGGLLLIAASIASYLLKKYPPINRD